MAIRIEAEVVVCLTFSLIDGFFKGIFWLTDWLVGEFIDWLIGWSTDWLVGEFIDWLIE